MGTDNVLGDEEFVDNLSDLDDNFSGSVHLDDGDEGDEGVWAKGDGKDQRDDRNGIGIVLYGSGLGVGEDDENASERTEGDDESGRDDGSNDDSVPEVENHGTLDSEAGESEGTIHLLDIAKLDPVASIMTPKRLERLKNLYPSLHGRTLRFPLPVEAVSNPPTGWFSLYEDYVKYGLCLPIPTWVIEVLKGFGIALAQLHPKSVMVLYGLHDACGKAGVEFSFSLVRRLLRLQTFKKQSRQYTFYSYIRELKFVAEYPDHFGKWWKKYFFVEYDSRVETMPPPWSSVGGKTKGINMSERLSIHDDIIEKLIPYSVDPEKVACAKGCLLV